MNHASRVLVFPVSEHEAAPMTILFIQRFRWSAAALMHRGKRGLTSAASVPTMTDDEHVLYRSVRDGSLFAVGTDTALHFRTPGGAWRRIAWIDLSTDSTALDADPVLAAFAADRITHLRMLRRRVEVRPGVFGIVEAVRPSDRAAPQWRIHLDHPEHLHDPVVRQACRDVIRELRSLTGC
jgi:hypothetical protein